MVMSKRVNRKMRIRIIFAVIVLAIFAARTEAQAEGPATDEDVAELVALLTGEYSNMPQVRAARSSAQDTGSLPVELRDVHHMFATPVDMPNVPGATVYVEWRHNDGDGDISGQRVWAYFPSERGVEMKFYTLRETGRTILNGVTAPDDKTRAITLADLRGYPEGCDIVFERSGPGYAGRNDSGACVFTQSESPNAMKVDAYLRIMPDLRGKRTYMWFAPPGQTPSGEAHVEDWVYGRVQN
jgi:hypothetical protein